MSSKSKIALDPKVECYCSKCDSIKKLSEFYRSDTTYCKGCRKQINDSQKDYRRDYYLKNRDKIIAYNKQRYEKKKGEIKDYKRKWCQKNKGHRNVCQRSRRKTDTNFRLTQNLRTRIVKVLKGINKSASTMELVGCTIDEFKSHLQEQFQPGMTWENYGKWHIDHIMPCASFDLANPEQQRQCFHHTNMQPLWAEDNLAKGDRIAA